MNDNRVFNVPRDAVVLNTMIDPLEGTKQDQET
jgi:hypothetical protein